MGTVHAPQQTLLEVHPPYTLKITNFTSKLARAISEKSCGDIESQPFFSSRGYKMKLWVRLNEGTSRKTGYMGAYLCLLKSDRDGSLPWPFTKRFTFVLIDQQDDPHQRKNIERSIVPNGEESFERPGRRDSVGGGKTDFVDHFILGTRQYIRDHAVYIQVVIDP